MTARVVTLAEVEIAVCEHFKLERHTLRSRKRQSRIFYPRMIAMHLCRELTGASFASIGEHFGFDHATAVHAKRKVAGNPALIEHAAALRATLVADRPPALPLPQTASSASRWTWPVELTGSVEP